MNGIGELRSWYRAKLFQVKTLQKNTAEVTNALLKESFADWDKL